LPSLPTKSQRGDRCAARDVGQQFRTPFLVVGGSSAVTANTAEDRNGAQTSARPISSMTI